MKTQFFKKVQDKYQCLICPRECRLNVGQRGFCFVREAREDGIYLSTYGRSSGFAVDPIEKKPLYHFYPGSRILSFGTAGCNMGCVFCQNWDISKARSMDAVMEVASPEEIAHAALSVGAVAFTYNDPVVFYEYAIDTAKECRQKNIHTVAVTAGYIQPEPRIEFFKWMSAANVDLKSFREDFYKKHCGAHLEPVLDTLKYIKKQTFCWLEITTLVIPDENDSEKEIRDLAQWMASELGPEVPLHVSAFFPHFKMMNIKPTSFETLQKVRSWALAEGLHHVYTGNLKDIEGETTYCSRCHAELIIRDRYQILKNKLTTKGACPLCGTQCSGVFE